MLLPKRDWLILRARLRRFVSLAALPAMAMTMTAAPAAARAVDPSHETPKADVALSGEALADAGGVEVVQCNAFFGGAYERPDRSLRKTFETATRFARKLAREHAHAGVIGMQDVETSGDADRVRDILMAETGYAWKVRWFNRHGGPNAIASAGQAIFCRPALFDVVSDFGTSREGESVQVGGLLLRRKESTRLMAVFAGKLAWWGARESVAVDDEERVRQTAVLRAWIDEKTASHPSASRVVLMDLNDGIGSAAHTAMAAAYDDGGETAPTTTGRGAKRLDHVFWDYASAAKRPDAFGRAIVSADFGAGRRFVAQKVYLRAEGE